MKIITISVSDEDFQRVMEHIEKDRVGRPLVAVHGLTYAHDEECCCDDCEAVEAHRLLAARRTS